MAEERRDSPRLNLTRPVDGWFGDFAVRLFDISSSGALIQSEEPLIEEARALLTFFWRDEEISVLAETIRIDDLRAGVRFLDGSPRLAELIEESAAQLMHAREANASGDREANMLDGDSTLTAASAALTSRFGYLTLSLTPDGWKRTHSLIADQPDDGFTVSAAESPDQIAMLCETYENGDEDARAMTRILAAMSTQPA